MEVRTLRGMNTTRVSSPLGDLLLASDGSALTRLSLHAGTAPSGPATGLLGEVAAQLREYFAGERQAFDVPMNLEGTPFQRKVWAELLRIPFGEAISYAELARRVGMPTASRAVGSANGQNPVALIVPCHRVIAADGTLGGYGGGLDRKEWLLAHEGVSWRRTPTPARRSRVAHRAG